MEGRRGSWRRASPFTTQEREEATRLYLELHSLGKVAKRLRRSPSGVYRVLKQEHQPTASNIKVRAKERNEIRRLYYKKCCSANEIAEIIGISSTTAKYWVKKLESPIPETVRLEAGTRALRLSSGRLDLLPFVDRSHLRWADDCRICLRRANSHKVMLKRKVSAIGFAYVLGFYLAEGNKGKGPPDLRNTNPQLINRYHKLLKSVASSEFRVYTISAKGNRMNQQSIRVGGECMKSVFVNGIESTLTVFSGEVDLMSTELSEFGLAFLRGCSDGDGSVRRARQSNSTKMRMSLTLTEGKLRYALSLKEMFRALLGSGSVYHPKNRNYYLVIASLSPERALYLVTHDFFSERPTMRARLVAKALDSNYMATIARFYSLFGASRFSSADISAVAPEVSPYFVGRAVTRRDLLPVGVDFTRRRNAKWHRVYRLSSGMLRVAKRIMQS